ncbi:MAG: VCBS repeat-containing protein [Microthrixaceae bacterium]
MTSGAAIADVNSDGFDDIFLTRIGKPGSLYLNDGTGHFTRRCQGTGKYPAQLSGLAQRLRSLMPTGIAISISSSLGRSEQRTASTSMTVSAVSQIRLGPEASYGLHETRTLPLPSMGFRLLMSIVGYMDLLVLHWYTDMYSNVGEDMISQRLNDRKGNQGITSCDANKLVEESGYPLDRGRHHQIVAC